MLAVLDIGNYTENLTLVLTEAAKYFFLLLFCVLSIRLWRRWAGRSAAKDLAGLLMAAIVTLLAVVIGFFSMRQSLGTMYSYYGLKAFRNGQVLPALSLFEAANGYWPTADTIGRKGVCLLLLGQADQGRGLIANARAARPGGSPFESFYEGVYLFSRGDTEHSIPLLQMASTGEEYHWSVVKIFAVMYLEANQVADARKLMQPFLQVEVVEPDQAYIMAGLQLAAGNKAGARSLLDKFPARALSPMWLGRYEKLRAQLRD